MTRFKIVALALVGILAFASPVLADNIHIGNTTNNQGGQGGSATQGQSQNQGQQQGQQQGQAQGQSQVGVNVQGQKQEASNSGNQQNVKFESSMIPGIAVAPGLAAGGSQVCLGSFSVGISGPMAGIAFGKTVVDTGCEDRQNAVLLHNMGYKAEALELIKGGNARVRAVFGTDAPKAAAVVAPMPVVSVEPSIQQAMAATQAAAATSVQGQ